MAKIGAMVETNETEIRGDMDSIYINKTKQIINTGRLREEYMTADEKINFQNELANKMNQMRVKEWVGLSDDIFFINYFLSLNLLIVLHEQGIWLLILNYFSIL